MTRRSRIPPLPGADPELIRVLDQLDKRRLTPIPNLSPDASLSDVITKINALLAEMRLRDAMER